jgi:hypothetical protein
MFLASLEIFANYFYPHCLYSPWNLLINIYPKKSTTPLFLPGPPPLNILIFPNFSKSGPSQHLPWARCLTLAAQSPPMLASNLRLTHIARFATFGCFILLRHAFPILPMLASNLRLTHIARFATFGCFNLLPPTFQILLIPLSGKSCSGNGAEMEAETLFYDSLNNLKFNSSVF